MARRRFSPSIFGTLLTIAAVAVFARLGVWQLHRAEEKQVLLAQFTAGTQSTVELNASNATSLAAYQHVRMRGHYDPAHQVLLDNMPSQRGQTGFRVVTPFALEQGGWILVDRGWVPLGATRADLPDVALNEQVDSITGRFDALPRPGVRLPATAADPAAPWPRVMNYPKQSDVEAALGRELVAGLVLLDPDQPAGYERSWHAHFNMGPETHLGYAALWFAFAVVALITYVIVSLRRERNDASAAERSSP
ncbi:MAG TPA: SURF1 family protein [Povalibacter sp.]|nr:SURF1 family protein [Povalibacter sp.]